MGRQRHRKLLEHRLEDDRVQAEVDARATQEQVHREREESAGHARHVEVFNLLYNATANEVASFFIERFGEGNVLHVTLAPRQLQDTDVQAGRLHAGRGLVSFASSAIVDQLEAAARMSLRGQRLLSCIVGHKGTISFKRLQPSSTQEVGIEGSSLLFTCKNVMLGNSLGSNKVVFEHTISPSGEAIEVRCNSAALLWEFRLGDSRYRFEVLYRHVWGKAGLQNLEGGRAALLLPVRQPPRVFRLQLRDKDGEDATTVRWDERSWFNISTQQTDWKIDPEKWLRTTDFTPGGSIGSCLLYRFILPYTVTELKTQHQGVLQPLLRVGILREQPPAEDVSAAPGTGGGAQLLQELEALPFNVRYYVEALLTSGLVCAQHLADPQFFATLLEGDLLPEVVIQALSLMLAGRRRIASPTQQLRKLIQEIFHDHREMASLTNPLPEYCMAVGRVLVTPTRIVRLPTEVELSNRVLRHFRRHSDRFIRISFGEENGGVLHLGPRKHSSIDLTARVGQILNEGVEVAGRRFELLAFSSSQLKEHSVWAFAPLPELSAEDVRRWMGDFQNIRCVAKYAARMGQCFSSTLDTVEVMEGEVLNIPDVERNGYCFTDGCGLISPELADLVADKLRQQRRIPAQARANPSAYQLRYGGCKGVVVSYPDMPALAGRRMLVRPSMRKFEARAQRIEVCAVSRHLPAFLNRQIISILYQKSLGVPDSSFQELQDSMLKTLNRMLADPQAALHVLADYASIESSELVSSISSIISAGFDIRTEPYAHGVLSAIRAYLLKDLKNKTRIFVPEAALLMGVVDELGVLKYGQVSIQVDRSAALDAPQRILGSVFVAKNPCFHPGDVRFLQAVDHPGLRHLTNVVVFPQEGRRPHPNEISGSDLDGDTYFCCWRQSLIPAWRDHEPMEFPPPKPEELDHPVNIQDVAKFFVNHAISDNLGIIANAHLAVADSSLDGVLSERCIQLAGLHSQAVDFPKTGIVVEVPRELRPTDGFPDFMQKDHGRSYTSNTIIGRLYREVQDPESSPANGRTICALDTALQLPGHERYLDSARAHLADYEQQLIVIMHQFNIYDEFQLVTGCIVEWDTMRKKRRGKRFDAKMHVVEAVQALRKKYLRLFEEEFLDRAQQGDAVAEAVLQKASAWYCVTYDATHQDVAPATVRLYSFAWVVDKYLAQIKGRAAA